MAQKTVVPFRKDDFKNPKGTESKEEKLARLSSEIEEGVYTVNSEGLIDSLLDSDVLSEGSEKLEEL